MKVHVWGGISKKERTGICVFEGIMDRFLFTEIWDGSAKKYMNKIVGITYHIHYTSLRLLFEYNIIITAHTHIIWDTCKQEWKINTVYPI